MPWESMPACLPRRIVRHALAPALYLARLPRLPSAFMRLPSVLQAQTHRHNSGPSSSMLIAV